MMLEAVGWLGERGHQVLKAAARKSARRGTSMQITSLMQDGRAMSGAYAAAARQRDDDQDADDDDADAVADDIFGATADDRANVIAHGCAYIEALPAVCTAALAADGEDDVALLARHSVLEYVGISVDRHRVYAPMSQHFRPPAAMICVVDSDDNVVVGRLQRVVGLVNRKKHRRSSGRSNREPDIVLLIIDEHEIVSERCSICDMALLQPTMTRAVVLRQQDVIEVVHANALMVCEQIDSPIGQSGARRQAPARVHWQTAVRAVTGTYQK